MDLHLSPIGVLSTCYKEKFGIPRQPNRVKQAPGRLHFYPEFAREEAMRGLEAFSHIWLLFHFHKAVKPGKRTTGPAQNGNAQEPAWSPMVRPPRLGGNKKVGVFASRSPFRPNPIGLSCVKLESVEITNKGPVLHLSGVDIMNNTPILDIKPYLPYSDILEDATDGFAPEPEPQKAPVVFSDPARKELAAHSRIPNLEAIITGILENDPRPAYADGKANTAERVYGIRLFDFDLKFTMDSEQITVLSLL